MDTVYKNNVCSDEEVTTRSHCLEVCLLTTPMYLTEDNISLIIVHWEMEKFWVTNIENIYR